MEKSREFFKQLHNIEAEVDNEIRGYVERMTFRAQLLEPVRLEANDVDIHTVVVKNNREIEFFDNENVIYFPSLWDKIHILIELERDMYTF